MIAKIFLETGQCFGHLLVLTGAGWTEGVPAAGPCRCDHLLPGCQVLLCNIKTGHPVSTGLGQHCYYY